MLLIHPSVELSLSKTRDFMDLLDEAAVRFGSKAICRRSLENKLNYLRTYACGVGEQSGEIDEFQAACFLTLDSYEGNFLFLIKARPEPTLMKTIRVPSFQEFQMVYERRIINGGLIWHGPKTVTEYTERPEGQRELRDVWGTHT